MAFSLGSLTKVFQSALGGTDSSVIGLDIGASSVKIVQLRASHGTAVLETYGEIALGPYTEQAIGKSVKLSNEKVSSAITDLMREANVTARVGGISIPFSSSLVTVLEVPKTDEESLKRMIPIEARKYIPVPVSEVTIDWTLIPGDEQVDAFDRVEADPTKNPARKQEVLLAAIHNDTVRSYQTIAAATGIAVKFFEIEIFSTIRSSLSRGVAPFLVVDIGSAMTKVYVVERGIVRASHLITQGGMHMTESLALSLGWDFEKAERVKRESGMRGSKAYSESENAKVRESLLSTLERLLSEANRVLLSYGKRYNKNVLQVVFTGGASSLPGLAEEATRVLGVESVIADPFSKTEAPAFLQNVLKEIGPSFAVALGLALRELKLER